MSKASDDRNLSDIEIAAIEQYLNDGKSPAEIGRLLGRDPSGIRKEIKNFSSFFGSRKICDLCLNRKECKIGFLCNNVKDYTRCSRCKGCEKAATVCSGFRITLECDLLKKKHICNSCQKKESCKVTLRYIAYQSILKHEAAQNRSHAPLKFECLPQEFQDYLSDRICAGISPDIILNRLPERFLPYRISTPTFYSYIGKGLLKCSNLDLKTKVSRSSYGTAEKRRNITPGKHQLNGRSIENLSKEELERPLGVAEMDTVEGIKGGAVLLTLMIPKYSLMMAFKMNGKNQAEVKLKLNILEFKLGKYFKILFSKIIPDNGSEFLDYEALEKSIHGKQKRCQIYYTHPYASYEKPYVENNHILLRWLIRKGFDISLISDDKIIEILNILNNYPRPLKGYKTPIELMEEEMGKEVLKKLNLKKIPIEDLNLHISLTD
ncbi:MAG: IS30 family transposase [Erysipelotrichaceae bacterium]|nr:IS30 family transposase [Erysipelotrichaceae bacterium]